MPNLSAALIEIALIKRKLYRHRHPWQILGLAKMLTFVYSLVSVSVSPSESALTKGLLSKT